MCIFSLENKFITALSSIILYMKTNVFFAKKIEINIYFLLLNSKFEERFFEVFKMRVKCVMCDKVEAIKDDSFQAKRLRNRPIYTYMCEACHTRIKERTEKRIATGNFHLYRSKKNQDDWDQ